MPVKWTPDNDQLLLLKILETHDINVDAKKISAAWPTEKGEAPTARAITERLVKIRQLARANGSGHFGISSSQVKSSSGKRGVPRTPSKSSSLPVNDASDARLDSVLIVDDDEPVWTPKYSREETLPVKTESAEQCGSEVVEDIRNPRLQSTLGGTSLSNPSIARQSSTSRTSLEIESPSKRAKLNGCSLSTGERYMGSESDIHWRSQAPSASTDFDDADDVV